MRWARIDQNGTPSYAVIEGDTVIPVRGSPFDAWERTGQKLRLATSSCWFRSSRRPFTPLA